jgi:glycosyltransferase involved in cell wall biosynthesis
VKRLLWVAWFFPPIGGGGCQRTLKLVRYLEPLGWVSTVLTARDPDYWILDPTLLDEVPTSAEVIRVQALTAQRLLRLMGRRGLHVERHQEDRKPGVFRALRRLQSWFVIPDGYRPFARAAARAAARRIEAGGVDALWTTSSPESAHLAGLSLKRRFGIPWVADFRDPWVGRVTYRPASSWHDARHRAYERSVVEGADRVTVVSEAMAALYRERYPTVGANRIVVLPNGVDSDDWRRSAPLSRPAREAEADRGRFVLLHAGQLAHRPTARTLLEGARRAIAAEPRLARELRIRFLGGNEDLPPGDRALRGLENVVAFAPSRPHLEAMAAMRHADALALLGHGGSADATLFTGKIYEYATSGRPVLGILDPGPAANLLLAAGFGPAVRAGDADGVARIITGWIDAWRRGESLAVSPPEAMREGWERRFLAGQAARILAEIAR